MFLDRFIRGQLGDPQYWSPASLAQAVGKGEADCKSAPRAGGRHLLMHGVVLVLLAGAPALPAAILWSDPGAVLAHDSGPGRDILNGTLKRDDSSRDTLYFRLHVSPLSDSSTEEYYAAFELFEGDSERLGVGNALAAYAYSAFFKTHAPDGANPAGDYVDLHSSSLESSGLRSTSSYEFPRRGQERTIVFKVQYVPDGDDLITVWLSPDLSAGATEIHQPETLTTRFSANASFDEIRLRHGGRGDGWVFSDLAVSTSFADFVDPSRAMSSALDSGSFFDMQPFGFETWLRDPGMPRTAIHALTQTSDGYLWLAATNQLARFDGVRFVPFSLPAEMAGDTIVTLLGDSQGALWIGTRHRGLVRHSASQFENFTDQNGLPTNSVTAIAEGTNAVWIGTTAGVVAWDHKAFHKVKAFESLDGHCITTLFQDHTGVLWLGVAGKGVFWFQDGVLSRLVDARLNELLLDPQCLLVDRNSRLWIQTGDDIVLCREAGEWHRYRIPRQSTVSVARALALTPDGTVWAGSATEGLFQIKQGKLSSFDASAGLPYRQVSALLVDREGNLWIGGGSGLHLLKRKQCFALGQAEGLGHGMVSGLAEVTPGVIWATQPGRGLYRWEGSTFRRLSAAGLSSDESHVGTILVTHDGACWLACTNGLLLFRDPQAVADEALLFELPHASITALAEASDRSIWAGTRQGQLWRLRQGRWHLHENFTSPFPITVMVAEPNGNVWIGTDGGGLYLLDESIRAHFDKTSGFASDSVRALHRDASGTLWIGTEGGGLIVLSNQVRAVFSTTAGLPDNTIHSILEDRAGRLWLNDGAGLTCIEKPLTSRPSVDLLGVYPLAASRADDPSARERTLRALPCLRDRIAGRLWFASFDGIAAVEPPDMTSNTTAPSLILEEVLVDGIPAPAFQPVATHPQLLANSTPRPLQIGPGNHRLDLHYTSPQFGAPEKLRFRYRLEGLDQDWVEAGTARMAQYNHVPPGAYRFTVALYRPDGKFVQTSVGLSVSHHFWQRRWVIAAGAVSLLAVIGGAVRFAENRRMKGRLRRLEQQNLLERERIRIAQDLHDEMGAKLCRISFLSEHAARFEPGSGQVQQQIVTIAHDSRELLHSLDEIVWAVNPHNDTLEHVASYIGQYTQDYFQATGTACELDIAGDLPHLVVSSQIRHHLFLAVHEALTNVLKHSGATLVKVAVACNGAGLQIKVEDNGRGFIPGALPMISPKGEDARDGLRNMRQRIEAVGGRCSVNSVPGHGTAITFQLNLLPPGKQAKP